MTKLANLVIGFVLMAVFGCQEYNIALLDLDNDGFSEGGGYYVLQLDENIAKVRIDGRRHLRFSPVFKLVDVANRDVWAYLDGRLIRDVCRTDVGDLLIEVPGVISREALLEVTSRVKETPGE